MVDPFMAILTDSLHSKYNKIMELALRAMTQVFRLSDMPSSEKFVPHITTRVFKLMRRGGTSPSAIQLNQACFKLAAILVRECTYQPLNENQV